MTPMQSRVRRPRCKSRLAGDGFTHTLSLLSQKMCLSSKLYGTTEGSLPLQENPSQRCLRTHTVIMDLACTVIMDPARTDDKTSRMSTL